MNTLKKALTAVGVGAAIMIAGLYLYLLITA